METHPDVVKDDLPTTVTCPVCGQEQTWAEAQGNMHGGYCSADCAVIYAIPLRQRSLFPDGEAPYFVSPEGDAVLPLPAMPLPPEPDEDDGAWYQGELAFA